MALEFKIMGIEVKEIALHQLIKDNAPIGLSTKLRSSVLKINGNVEQMMELLHQTYQSKGKSYGIFKNDSQFAQWFKQWLTQGIDFFQFSCQGANLLAEELGKYSFASDGTFIFCQYNFLATDYLFVALLNSRTSLLVDEELNIQPTNYLDISQYDIACRINLAEFGMEPTSDRYLTFIKGRVGRKVSDFFMDFLGAEEGLNPKVQNQCLVQAVSDYCRQEDLTPKQSQEIKGQVLTYCKEQAKAHDEINLNRLSQHISGGNKSDFEEFVKSKDYALAENIPPVQSSLKALTKYSGAGKGVSISFDANLLHNRIQWDEENDRLIIQGLPPNLRDQLIRNK